MIWSSGSPGIHGYSAAVDEALSIGAEWVWNGIRSCSGVEEQWWGPGSVDGPATPAPSVGDLLPGAILALEELVPAPTSAVSPPSGVVNFGMWLAVAAEAPVAARVTDSGAWAQATATVESVTFDMGTGDVIECSGFGDLLTAGDAAWDTDEQSPICGYTYRVNAPTAEGFPMTITLQWSVRHTGSNGLDEAGSPLTTSYSLLYPVVEIQTVGVDPDS